MIFIDNKYTNIYYQIINRGKTRILNEYTETHHIIPRSLGGTDDSSNLVKLTAREHFICHLLLPKMTSGEHRHKMIYAYIMMSGRKLYNSKLYNYYRNEYAVINSEKMSGPKNPMYSVDRAGKKNPFYGRTHSQETKKEISQKRKGHSDNKGIPKSEEHKRKISEARKQSAKKYKFYHKDGSIFEGSTTELAKYVRSNPAEPWKLVNGKYKTHKGWKVVR